MAISALEILRSARQAVPAVDYALGVAGLAAAASIVGAFLGYSRSSIIVLGGIFIAMILLFAFAGLVKSQSSTVYPAGVVLLYSVILFFCTFLGFTVTAVGFGWPPAWADALGFNSRPAAANQRDPALPARLADIQDAQVRLRRVDDFAWVYVNDSAVVDRAVYGETPAWTPIRRFLKSGRNEIRVVIKNGEYGGCGAELDVTVNGKRVDSFDRAWFLPTERASVNGLCFDESIEFQLQ
jgi:hypothetical protein